MTFDASRPDRSTDIAIVGMAGIFPGASTAEDFWNNLNAHTISFSSAPPIRKLATNRGLPRYAGFISRAECFDAPFFGMTEEEASRTDPQQRLLLQLAWQTLEDAGTSATTLRGQRGGVFISASLNEYSEKSNAYTSGQSTSLSDLYSSLVSNRISHFFDWCGPSELIQTACTGSLVAIHHAVRALRYGECNFALAGGASLMLSDKSFLAFENDCMISTSQQCRVFHPEGDGILRGEAAALILLKPIDRALRDGDRIDAIIKGSAVSHSGASRSFHSLTQTGQQTAASAALKDASIDPATICFLEIQGTGRPTGDAKELNAVLAALHVPGSAPPTERWLGCIKPNVGHLETVMGVAAIIKLALSFRFGHYPALTGYNNSTPLPVSVNASGCSIVDQLQPSQTEAVPIRASVSGFGFGGTNAHLILEAPCSLPTTSHPSTPQPILLSALDRNALLRAAKQLNAYLQTNQSMSLTDLSATLRSGRVAMPFRIAFLASSIQDIALTLQTWIATPENPLFLLEGQATLADHELILGGQEEDQTYFKCLWSSGRQRKLLHLWTQGAEVLWEHLSDLPPGRKLSLPTYPFADDFHWIGEARTPSPTPSITTSTFDGVVEELFQIIQPDQAIGIISDHSTFNSLGIDSLTALKLQSRLEHRFHHALPLALFLNRSTLGDVLQHLQPAQYDSFPLTDMQMAYFLSHAHSQNGCHLYWEFERDQCDRSRLQTAWLTLVQRHEMLRAIFTEDAQQRILSDVPPYQIENTDLREQTSEHIGHTLSEIRDQLSQKCFDPSNWPLFNIATTQLPTSTRIHISVDLLIADCMSLFLLLNEWSKLYDSLSHSLAPLTVTFRDHITLDRESRTQSPFQSSLQYWRSTLKELPAAPALPYVGRPDPQSKNTFRRHEARLSGPLWEKLQQQAADHGLTPAATLLSAFAEVLTYWSEPQPFTLNLTVSKRPPTQIGLESVVGDFTSNILLACGFDTNAPFHHRASQLAERLTHSLDHSIVSGVEVLRMLSEGLAESVLMPVVFTSFLGYRGSDGKPLSLDHFGKFITGLTHTPHVWMDAQVLELDGGLYISLDTVDDILPKHLAPDLLLSWFDLLQRLSGNSATWDDHFPVRLPRHQTQSRQNVNDTNSDFEPKLLQQGFLEQAALQPNQIAIHFQEKSWTYSQIFSAASIVASRLLSHNIHRGDLIAIVMPKSPAQIIAALGILMAGAAYLPIEATLPQKRMHELLALGNVKIALVNKSTSPNLPNSIQTMIVDDSEHPQSQVFQKVLPTSSDDIAYVIFTSGSTGTPKGVVITHKAAANTIRDINKRFRINSDDRILALSSLSFDLSVYDIFGTLAAGATIVLPDEQQTRDPQYLRHMIETHSVTVWNSVPTYLQMLLQTHQIATNSQLRLILLSGDWIPVTLPQQAWDNFPQVVVVSLGGATEASIWSIFHIIEPADTQAVSIPYGKPLANQSFHVLDAYLQDAPDWVAGELYIGGIGLAKEYWRDASKTAAAFSIRSSTDERLYRTGDWGRYLPDSSIQFLGRRDLQVKVGGYRIELGDIESALLQWASVGQAVAFTYTDEWNQKSLAALIVANSGKVAQESEVRDYLKSRLPGYMLPQQIRFVSSLPLTANGKVDRANLQSMLHLSPSEKKNPILDAMQAPGMLKTPADRHAFVDNRAGLRKAASQSSVTFDSVEEVPHVFRSTRNFSQQLIPKTALANLLGCLRDHGSPQNKSSFLYPSAGDSYAVQTYIEIKPERITGVGRGLYYYHPFQNELHLLEVDNMSPALHLPANQKIADSAAFTLYLIADLNAIRPLYGSLSDNFCYLEAGHMGQLLRQSATHLGLGLCPIGQLLSDDLHAQLKVTPDHRLLYTFLAGLPAAIAAETTPVPVTTGSLTSLQHLLATTWSEVLRHPVAYPLDANLFELGGNSFAALELHKLLTQREGLTLTVTDLFRYPTVRLLAEHLQPSSQQSRQALRRSIRTLIAQGGAQ